MKSLGWKRRRRRKEEDKEEERKKDIKKKEKTEGGGGEEVERFSRRENLSVPLASGGKGGGATNGEASISQDIYLRRYGSTYIYP